MTSRGQWRVHLILIAAAALMVLPRIIRAFAGGDDHLLTRICSIVEDRGFRLLGAHEVAPEILVPLGQLGRHAPSERDRADIAVGQALLATMGPFDIGQAVVVAGNRVIAVEAAEGTDRMLARIATDENLHMVFYRNLLGAAFELAPDLTMQAVRDGTSPARLAGSASKDVLDRATAAIVYEQSIKRYLGGA